VEEIRLRMASGGGGVTSRSPRSARADVGRRYSIDQGNSPGIDSGAPGRVRKPRPTSGYNGRPEVRNNNNRDSAGVAKTPTKKSSPVEDVQDGDKDISSIVNDLLNQAETVLEETAENGKDTTTKEKEQQLPNGHHNGSVQPQITSEIQSPQAKLSSPPNGNEQNHKEAPTVLEIKPKQNQEGVVPATDNPPSDDASTSKPHSAPVSLSYLNSVLANISTQSTDEEVERLLEQKRKELAQKKAELLKNLKEDNDSEEDAVSTSSDDSDNAKDKDSGT